jgi:hypothetical protein
MNDHEIREINNLLSDNKVTEAKHRFEQLNPENSVGYFLLKGKLEQKYQNWGAALNAFSKVIEMDENNAEAQNSIHFIQNILNFWNPEMFNP